jgi:hypothetical protein
MSRFLDELLSDLGKPDHEMDEVENDVVETIDDENEAENHNDVSEEIEVVAEEPEASKETTSDDDDDTELTPVERKAWGRLKALQDEREKRRSADEGRKAAEAERDQLRQDMAEMHRQRSAQAAQNLPDPMDDPHGYIAAREAEYQVNLTRQALGFSIQRAVEKHGEDEVVQATQWFEDQMAANPSIPLRQNMLSQADQMEYVLSSYKQARAMSALSSGDYSGLVAELQKAGYNISKAETVAAPAAPVTQTAAAPVAPVRDAPAAPKRSKLATATSAITAPPASVSMLDNVLRRK